MKKFIKISLVLILAAIAVIIFNPSAKHNVVKYVKHNNEELTATSFPFFIQPAKQRTKNQSKQRDSFLTEVNKKRIKTRISVCVYRFVYPWQECIHRLNFRETQFIWNGIKNTENILAKI